MSVPKVNTELGLKIRGSARNSSNLLLGSAFRESKVSTLVVLLLEELNERMLKQHDRFLRQYIIPRKIHLLTPDTTNKIFNIYEPDLTERTVFDDEIVRWKAKWAHVDPENKPTTLHHTLCSTNRELHPNVTAILTIIVTMPVSTATPERFLVLCGGLRPICGLPCEQRGCLVSLSCTLTGIGPSTPTKSSRSFVLRSYVDWHSNFERL